VKPHALLVFGLVACTHTAAPLVDGETPARDAVVLSGEVSGCDVLHLRSANGRRYMVRAPANRFAVVVPAGVYEVESVGGVVPRAPLTLTTVPGDVCNLGRLDVTQGRVDVYGSSAGGAARHGGGAAYFGGRTRSGWNGETPLFYYTRTGEFVRPLPGYTRAGQGLGFRSR
jgi:hypothetical protein